MTFPGRRPPRPFYGWIVVASLMWILAIGVGITFYGLSVYLSALAEGPGSFSLTTASAAIGVFLVSSGAAGLLVARLLRHVGPRAVILAGLVVSATSILLISRSQSAWHLHASYLLLGIGFAALSVIPASNLVTAWFVRRRTAAMSVTFVGLPLGGALVTPPVALLVEARGIEGAGPWLAGALLLLTGPAVLLLHPDPRARGTAPDGDAEPEPSTRAPVDGVAMTEAIRSSWFVLVTLALALGMFGQLGTLSHLYNAVLESIPSAAAVSVSLVSAASLVGRIAGSWVLGRVRLLSATVLLMVVQAASMVLLAVSQHVTGFVVAATTFGLTVGNMQVLQPLLLAERFGNRDFAGIFARGNLFVTLGMAAGPPAIGLMHDRLGSYLLPLVVAAGPVLLGATLMAWASRDHTPLTTRTLEEAIFHPSTAAQEK